MKTGSFFCYIDVILISRISRFYACRIIDATAGIATQSDIFKHRPVRIKYSFFHIPGHQYFFVIFICGFITAGFVLLRIAAVLPGHN